MEPERGEHTIERLRDRVTVLSLSGEHDMDTVSELSDPLMSLARSNDLLVVDLTGTTFVDSSVLLNLVMAERVAHEHGGTFRIQRAAAPIVRKAFDVSGLTDHFEIVPDRSAAVEGFVD
ncbi:MAG TPA: STAS domain-containing protein [Gaiellaceae bacterium]|jgi:stage II sporulation protein AA (anti-sigma F factor antagonist)